MLTTHQYIYKVRALNRLIYREPERVFDQQGIQTEYLQKTPKQRDELERKLQSQKNRIEKVKEVVSGAQERLEELEKQKIAIQQQIRELQGEKKGLDKTLEGLEKELQKIEKEKIKIQTVVNELQGKITELEGKIENLEKDIEQYRQDLEAQQKEQERLDELQKNLEKERADAERYSAGNAALVRLGQKIKLPKKIMKKSELDKNIKIIAQQRDEDLKTLEAKKRALAANRGALDATRQRLRQLEQDIGKATNEVEKKQEQLPKAKEKHDVAVAKQVEIGERATGAEKRRDQVRSSIEELGVKLESAETEAKNAEKEEKNTIKKKEEAIAKLPSIERTLTPLLATVKELLKNPTEKVIKLSGAKFRDFFAGIEETWQQATRDLAQTASEFKLDQGFIRVATKKSESSLKDTLDEKNPQESLNTYLKNVDLHGLFVQLLTQLQAQPKNEMRDQTIAGIEGLTESFKTIEEELKNAFVEQLREEGTAIKPMSAKQRNNLEKLVQEIEESLDIIKKMKS